MSPFRLMCKVSGRGSMVATLGFGIMLFTSHTAGQVLMAFVIYVLSLLLSALIGFYVACRYQVRREEEWQANALYSIHYPLTMEFEIKKHHMDQQVRKHYRPRTYA